MTTLVAADRPQPQLAPAAEPTWAWRSGSCTALEHSFEVLVERREDVALLLPVLAPFRARLRGRTTTTPSARYEVRWSDTAGRVSLLADGERLGSSRSVVDLLGAFAWHVNRSVIDASVDRYLLMHAACAVTGGITVVLAGDMESGKTTTIAGLLRDGFDYVTDEAVAVDPVSCTVSPFPKTLSLDRGSWALFPECRPADVGFPRRQWFVSPHQLGSRSIGHRVAPPRVILFPQYVAGAQTAILPVSGAEAGHELARTTFHVGRHARRNLETVARLVARATVARLRIGDLDDAVSAVADLVSQRILEDL